MRPVQATLLATLAILLSSPTAAATDASGPPNDASGPPNIVLIMSDDMGFSDVGCYGGEIDTPNLDRLAAGGLRFTQFYNTARCCPTRAALLTGVYSHQAGIGAMTDDRKLPGYRGDLGHNVLTIAEALGTGGYRSYMAGKWHVTRFTGPDGPKDNWPLQRGFDRFYGTITGAGSFYDPATLCRGNTYITPVNDPEYQPETYYYTDAISDNAVMFLDDHAKQAPKDPFFLYVSYTAPHWPMHALPEDIAKYKGKYDGGFAPIRAARLKRLKELGILDPSTELSPPSDDWEQVEDKAWEARNMEVYAAMIDNMDQGIGRIVAEIERQGKLDNTLILFLHDNGGCAEGFGRYPPHEPYPTDLKPMGPDELQTKIWPPMQTRDGRPVRVGPGVMAGPEDTFIAYGRGWANVSNTPFREYKHFSHEGGISTPLIVHWPRGIAPARHGKLVREPGHVIDVMATCVDLAGVQHPSRFGEHEILPLEGVSLKPAFSGDPLHRTDALYFEHFLKCAIRDGDWKLVRKGQPGRVSKLLPWELYEMRKDRTELHDLSKKHPEKVAELSAKWEAWAERANVKPWPWEFEGDD
jgi:arylsulfatase A-like enzyme